MTEPRPGCARMALSAAFALFAATTGAGAQENPVEEGKFLYQRANCAQCHGWAGDGGGATWVTTKTVNLRRSEADYDRMFLVIRCSLPFSEMPFYERLGYTDERCHGFRAVDLPGTVPPLSLNWLSRAEIDLVVQFVRAKMVGRGAPTYEECVEYFGATMTRCEDYAKTAR